MYRPATGQVGFATGGVQTLNLGQNVISSAPSNLNNDYQAWISGDAGVSGLLYPSKSSGTGDTTKGILFPAVGSAQSGLRSYANATSDDTIELFVTGGTAAANRIW
jgi:hypothetical protein